MKAWPIMGGVRGAFAAVRAAGARRAKLRAKVFEDRETPGQWRVEWFDDDGACELVEIFTGPDARRRALRYAVQKYGH